MSNVAKAKEAEAELHHDDTLFSQPEGTHLGECPICFLPLPIEPQKSLFKTCCSEIICQGCRYANIMSNKHDEIKACSCPFCREEPAVSGEENRKRIMNRVKANDPAALHHMGKKYYDEGDYNNALKYLIKAAELGDLMAYYQLGRMYEMGRGVEEDVEKAIYHFETAAIGGHPHARHNLAVMEARNGNMERAVKHAIIAAKLGYDDSMKALWIFFKYGDISKEDLDATLRTNQTAIDGMKSEQRDFADHMRRQRL